MDTACQNYLNRYLHTLPRDVAVNYQSYSADYFCADEVNANLCADLILRGEKTATCSLEYWYSQKGEIMPKVGHLQVVTNWQGDPVCIIEITSVSQCQYNEITAEFASAEGEGDKSLEWWKDAHWRFFSLECEELDIEVKHDMLLVLERFKVVYPQIEN